MDSIPFRVISNHAFVIISLPNIVEVEFTPRRRVMADLNVRIMVGIEPTTGLPNVSIVGARHLHCAQAQVYIVPDKDHNN